MELQELVLRAITVQMRFGLAPAFADNRGRLINTFREDHGLSDYGWGESALRLTNPEVTRILIAGGRELRFSYEHIDRLDDVTDAARRFFEHGLAVLEIDKLDFLGVRTYWLAAVDSFDELRDWLIAWLARPEPISTAVAAHASDVGWVYEYRDQSPEHTVRLGPMRVEQLLEQIFATDERDLFPEQFLYVDLDRVYRGDDAPSGAEAVTRMENAIRGALGIGERLGSAVLDRLTED